MRIVFVEGVPGVGKSTISEQLCTLFAKRGHHAKWYLEESLEHPIHPPSWRAGLTVDRYVEECLNQWSKFADMECDKGTVHIFDGSAFQSTVRFMMEKRSDGVDSYFLRFEQIIISFKPRMLYLRPNDVVSHSKYVCGLRGNEWATKVSEYLADTDYSGHSGLSGLEGMHQFWRKYAELCDSLVKRTAIPTKTIEFVAGEWERHMAESVHFLDLNGKRCFR